MPSSRGVATAPDKKIIPETVYNDIKDHIIARQAAAPATQPARK